MHIFFMLLVKKFLLGHNEFKILVSLWKRSWYAAKNAGNSFVWVSQHQNQTHRVYTVIYLSC